ncbi:bifunctional aminoglycoside phosphotransferase/ATP-binding protein [Jhaorihella thermophila]|uniref:Aminoglycoside phosphotransferase domain-containing protein n=1 Tax=Jhaorihella thermophila TaxID=488547 RepID=A0A1H5TFC8_9RHOB|nr:bifunctional aminoglycoside phosphotransferase/ATP-binding protein [Jhaorihella thermophila]SEF60717.1 hypothetical protein SAMN05421751_102209 [Jhaorihella thermophila]
MICEDQTATIAFLSDPATHGQNTPVRRVETHISEIFLTRDRAFKLKRAVKLPYADFSTPRIRLATCEKEYALNAPHAPGLYLGVRRITRAARGGLEFDGDGPLVDAVVEMARFDDDALLSKVAERRELTSGMVAELARVAAEYHAAAPEVHAGTGAENIAGVLDINRAGFATSTVFSETEVDALDADFRAALQRYAGMLDARESAGKVRRCHGDLHLGNICLFHGRPTPFDCIEFNDRIATVDVLYDLAFLLMDLWFRGLPGHANLAANRYCDETGEDEGFALLPFLMAVRAAVRAHVTATRAEDQGADRDRLAATARRYFDLAATLLRPIPPRAVVIGGLSGTGKTTLAEALAAHVGAPPGARIVESDRTRKAMFGVPGDTRLPPDAYAPPVSDRVYARLGERARALLGAGATVIVDAVFDRPDRRDAIEAAIAETGTPCSAFWLVADADALRARVAARRGGPSDATVDVLERQLRRDPGPVRWAMIPTDRPLDQTLRDILDRLAPDQDGPIVEQGTPRA